MNKFVFRYKLNNEIKESSVLENDDYLLEAVSIDGRTTYTITVKREIELVYFEEFKDFKIEKQDKFLLNGYQSWTDTKEFYAYENIRQIKMPKLACDMFKFRSYGDYNFKQTRKDILHGYTYSYGKTKSQNFFIGSLNEKKAYLVINYYTKENKIGFESDCNGKIVTNKFVLLDYYFEEGDVYFLQKEYFSKFAKKDNKKIKGYTSWYNDYQNINENKIEYALKGINKEQYDLFQIDDGYETFVGDWLDIDSNKFPNGLAPIVTKIHEKGLLAGIWLAPFVCELNSKFYKDRNDLCYKENGQDVFAGGNWSKFVPLDISNPEALNYIEKCLKYYVDLGFDFFKLDFLYAAAIIRGKGLTKAETTAKMFRFLRDILGDKLILGCGAQLSSAFGVFDYCRIGPDVSLVFDDVFYMKWAHRERISTKITLQNTIYRSLMDGKVFRNDPDVYLLRDDNIKLNKEQKRALLIINTLCGSVYFTSDNVSEYDEEKVSLLKDIQILSDAEVLSFDREKDLIIIKYLLNSEEKTLVYDTKKGVIANG